MSTAIHETHESHEERTATGVPNLKLGMWLFLASEVMFFTGFIGSYVVLRLGSKEWPDPAKILGLNVLAVNTFILICSSVTMVLALQGAREGDRKATLRFLGATIALGSTFLAIKLLDYRHLYHEGFTIDANIFGSFYYMLTGFHGLHVFGGIVALGVILIRTKLGHFGDRPVLQLESAGLYWHFVDLVWIVLFAILCLV